VVWRCVELEQSLTRFRDQANTIKKILKLKVGISFLLLA
jgi:hypothetical protein